MLSLWYKKYKQIQNTSMTKFIVVFLPNIIRDGNVGDVISLLESLKLIVDYEQKQKVKK